MKIEVAQDQLWEELEKLATFSDTVSPAITRIVFSEQDLKARGYFKKLCSDAGLVIREDAVGNTFARWVGSNPDEPAVGTGSHIDAIPSAGRFDGTVGVLGGLEAIRALKRAGHQPLRSIELLLFTSEEPTRFGIGCLGSRLLSGALGLHSGTELKDREGHTLDAVRTAAGFEEELATVALPKNYYSAFLELHIEQGPLLERDGIPIGVVQSIAAPASLRVTVEGEGGHAGAVLMPQRRDAFCAAADIVLAVENAAKATGSIDTVATAGVCDIYPGAVNSIPSRVRLELDVRDTVEGRRDSAIRFIAKACKDIANRRGVRIKTQTINSDSPAKCDPALVEALSVAATKHGLAHLRMISRAYHDTLFMTRIAPAAMVFIPCRSGFSHRPEEYASPEAIASGVLVLAEALAVKSA